jgi:flagellar biosynthesis anti-sigma factor FlgM
MRINGPGGLTTIQKAGGTAKGKSTARGSGDSVKVSDAASLREKAQTMLSEMSDVRMERIEAIRDALESGTFKSDSRQVATRIVSNALAEHMSWS